MTTLRITLPDRLAQQLRAMVQEGWFTSEEEAVRAALWEFFRRYPLQLTEQFLLEDIEWARRLRQSPES
jgi:Arc/MetJ-type ribon-helix-helix transcriptional regulator